MKPTPLTHLHRAAGARIVEFAGFEMPVEYSGVIDEHQTVRNSAGIFDVCHMGEFWISGPGALGLLQYVTTNDVASLRPGHAHYTCMPNGKGGIVDDLIIYRYAEEKYMLVVNASNTQKDWDWLSKHNRFGAEMENASEAMSLIALQGPKAKEILQTLVAEDLDSLKSFTFLTATIPGAGEQIISATGYTGAGGFELYGYNEGAVTLWQKLIEAGEPFGLKPAGLAARDTLRLEKGYCLYGNDIDDTTSPIEAGLGWIVKFSAKGEFVDRNLLEKQKAAGPARKLVGLEMLDRGIPRHEYPVLNSAGERIGMITSGTMSPTLKKGIGMAYIQTEYAGTGTEVFVEIRNRKLKGIVVKLPFL
ncbi:MAG: glycine cleavage system aminomethyltransferase GcvT [Bacteroidales bacterium]|nr:glycine cleavage system aminomethyltransferase GcvT [Bacteroidales bacterium]